MQCRQCAAPLDRPGDYCLVCRTANADTVVIACEAERATVTVLREDEAVGEWTVTARRETDGELARAALRNLAGRIADEVRRKRPEDVYAAGDRDVIQGVRERLHHDVRRVPADDPVGAAVTGDEADLAVVDLPPAEKLGGTHTTLVGGREGQQAVGTVAGHPHVKKVVPGPIDGSGSGTSRGSTAKVTRADGNGNLRLLLRDGSSVQETRVVTTAADRETGERVRDDLNRALDEAGFQ